MAASITWTGYEELQHAIGRVISPDEAFMEPLLLSWRRIMTEDNRKGVLSGQDKDGLDMIPVKYRTGIAKATKARGSFGSANRKNSKFGKTVGTFHAFDPFSTGLHGNLPAAEYRKLTGPPLAPQGEHSRVIAHYSTDSGQTGPTTFEAVGHWPDVVSQKGVPFLEAHFDGERTGKGHRVKLPVRDLRGVRPWGVREAMKALAAFADTLLRRAAR